jgi:NADPH-dependent ferric siderophore reductase
LFEVLKQLLNRPLSFRQLSKDIGGTVDSMTTQDANTTTNTIPAPRYWNPEEKAWVSARRPAPNPGEKPPQPAPRPVWSLTVKAVEDVTPGVRRIHFGSEMLAYFTHEPGSDFTLYIPRPDGETARRHYTARAFDPASKLLDIDFVMHGYGPAVLWAASARPGDRLDVSGPVVRHDIDLSADWHLFAGDESAIPAVFGVVESLPAAAKAMAYLEVQGPQERQPLLAEAEVDWLFRGDTPGDQSRLIQDAVTANPLPPGRGHVFLAGETGRMRELRKALVASGLEREQIFAMGYWRPGRFGGDETIRD